VALHALVAATPCVLALAQLDDLAGEALAVNLPGTDRERPNWRRRMARTSKSIFADPSVQTQLRAMSDGRS
jgi:4-alpha-glucanotransferase